MSDVSQGPGWWLASDGKWYPPSEQSEPPGPGWWLASDGKWYPPESRASSTTTSTTGGGASATSDTKPATPRKAVPAKRAVKAKRPPAQQAAPPQTPTGAPASGSGASAPSRTASDTPAKSRSGTGGPSASTKAKSSAPAQPKSTQPKSAAKKAPAGRKAAPKATGAASTSPKAAPPDRASLIRSNMDITPEQQIARRNQASRADALALASKRFDAASRALASLSKELDREKIRSSAHEDQLSTLPKAQPEPTAAKPPPPAPPLTPTEAPVPAPTAATPTPTKPKAPAAPSDEKAGARGMASPLLELKPSALTSDLSHAGDRLAIFNDRVELRDRNYKIRQRIAGHEITDVVIQKRLAGVILSIESAEQPAIIAKGLTLQQAEDARALILKKTRRAAPPAEGSSTKSVTPKSGSEAPASSSHESKKPTPPSKTTSQTASTRKAAAPASSSIPTAATEGLSVVDLDESDLLRKLQDLHHAGVLTDGELAEKTELVRRIARGEALTPTIS